jgi:hypothetical protein
MQRRSRPEPVGDVAAVNSRHVAFEIDDREDDRTSEVLVAAFAQEIEPLQPARISATSLPRITQWMTDPPVRHECQRCFAGVITNDGS